jgi:hypothetical protein
LALALERGQRAIDEIDHVRLARAGRLVGRNDLRGHRFDFRRLRRREERQADRLTGAGGLLNERVRLDNAGVVGDDPGSAQPGHRTQKKLPARLSSGAHGALLCARSYHPAAAKSNKLCGRNIFPRAVRERRQLDGTLPAR